MSRKKTDRGGFTWKERFSYWFDNRMARSSLGLIRSLIAASIALAVIIALLIVVCGFNEEGDAASVFWDSVATVINAWMPYYEDGGPGYLILMTVTALAGVLFTSVLIGIVTSAIEEKIDDLKRGNSRILETDHTVILGFYPGEYTLLRQLILAAGGEPACVVIADDRERDEMEQGVRDNVEAPKNFRIICRTADIFDPASLEKCSIETCRNVIVSPTDDARTIKALLAVSSLLQGKEDAGVRVSAILSSDEYRFPASLAERFRITALQRNDTLAKMIAHSCTQMGLAETFREVFSFEGAELYLLDVPGAEGLRFGELTERLDGGVPVGVAGADGIRMDPPADTVVRAGERLLVFADERRDPRLTDAAPPSSSAAEDGEAGSAATHTEAVILGCNESLPVILRELPENVGHVVLAGKEGSAEERGQIERIAAERGISAAYCGADLSREEELLALVRTAEHIVLLNDHGKDEEAADLETVFLLLRLRDLRTRYGLRYNITAELRRENNQNLVADGDGTDFIVASSMSSLLLAQLAESPELLDVFRELLSNEGCELLLKPAGGLGCAGELSVRELRRRALRRGYVLLGFFDADGGSVFDPPLDTVAALRPEDELIVLGES